MTPTDVEKLAYDLWEKDGRQHGRDQEYYLTAERILAASTGDESPAEAQKTTRTRTTTAKARSKKQA